MVSTKLAEFGANKKGIDMSNDLLNEEKVIAVSPKKKREKKRAGVAHKKAPQSTSKSKGRSAKPGRAPKVLPAAGKKSDSSDKIKQILNRIPHVRPAQSAPDVGQPVEAQQQGDNLIQSGPVPTEAPPHEPEAKPLSQLQQLVQFVLDKRFGGELALKKYLQSKPEIYIKVGDTAKLAREQLINLYGEGDPVRIQSVLIKTDQLLESHRAGRATCPTEEILIEQVIVNKLRLDYLDYSSPNYVDGAVPKLVKMMQQRHASAQAQLYRAIEKLETFRRLKQEGDD